MITDVSKSYIYIKKLKPKMIRFVAEPDTFV